jgi:hypothetical protein
MNNTAEKFKELESQLDNLETKEQATSFSNDMFDLAKNLRTIRLSTPSFQNDKYEVMFDLDVDFEHYEATADYFCTRALQIAKELEEETDMEKEARTDYLRSV